MATNIKKNTAKLMMQKLQSELDALFAEQQILNGGKNGSSGKGLPKAQGGIEMDDPYGYGMGYTNTDNYSFGKMFQDSYSTNFNIPKLTGNPIWFQNQTGVRPPSLSNIGPKYNSASTGINPSLRYTAPEDTWQPTVTPTVDAGSKMTFSNPLDDPNSKQFDPAKRTAEIGKKFNADTALNWGKAGTFAGQVAPMLYNMFKGLQRPEKTKPNYNPYEDEIRSTMRNRRFNVDPILNANRTAQAVSNRNIGNVANSRGELMSNLGASQNYRMTGDAAAYAQKNNMDNQYLAEQAQMDANLGANRAQMDWMTQDANARNKAATNSFLGQGFNDLGRFAQTQQLMSNQAKNSTDLARIFQDSFGGVAGFMPELQKILAGYNVTPKTA